MRTNRRDLLLSTATLMGGSLAAQAPCSAHVDPGEKRPSADASFKLSVAAYSYRDFLLGARKSMTLPEFIRRCADMGTDGVELTEYYFEKPITPAYVMHLKRTAYLLGQSITGTPVGNSFTLPPGPERDRQVKSVLQWIDISADLGSPAVRVFAGNTPRGMSDEQARKNAVQCLEQVLGYAEKRGVFLALENHGGVVSTPDGLLEIVSALKSPWMGVNLDTGNFHTEDPYADLARCAPYAVTVQYKVEMSPKGMATQPADFRRILTLLRGAGYRGFVTLEYEAAEDPMTAVPRHVALMRRTLSMAVAART